MTKSVVKPKTGSVEARGHPFGVFVGADVDQTDIDGVTYNVVDGRVDSVA